MHMTPERERDLLRLARERIEEKIFGNPSPAWERLKGEPWLAEKSGLFVTLKKDGDLRGCIGAIVGESPLGETVRDMAIQSAFFDPRFPPVEADELPGIAIEISVLTPLEMVGSWRDIVIGRDGMMLSYRGRQALFLPQVAPEQGWDLETTLSHLARKAGLPAEIWREPDCRFKTFQAIVFGEKEAHR
ncbi:MAG TPA: AmmeMemoRadiSam system protein A [bacterium]|nr:AmmeMemoRadiSam system protein A [bacterium]